MEVKSIHELLPLDISGRHARSGFMYQDHVGAWLCLNMLLSDSINQVWFEKEDDLTVIHERGGQQIIEFIQVKHNEHKTSRWSISDVASRKPGKVGSSLFEKLLAQDRCKESVLFKIISSYGLKKVDLEFLTFQLDSLERKNSNSKREKLIAELEKRLPGVKSPNNKSWSNFVDLCHWKKLPGTNEEIMAKNKLHLEKVFKALEVLALPDQRDEVYQKLLALVRDASCKNLIENPSCYKVEKEFLKNWIIEKVNILTSPHTEIKLASKMREANISEEIVQGATQIYIKYKKERLTENYRRKNDVEDLENQILYILHKLKVKLDAGEINLDGPQFHNLCMDEVEKVVSNPDISLEKIPEYFAVGLMYDITNRCSHRFAKVQP